LNPGKNILFIYPHYIGHLLKSVLIAKYFLENNWNIYYLSNEGFRNDRLEHFGFHSIITKSFPLSLFGSGKEGNLQIEEYYQLRKQELCTIIHEINPSLLFVDEFCAAELLFLLHWVDYKKITVLSTFLPSFPNNLVPPQSIFAMPSNNTAKIWKEFLDQQSSKVSINNKKEFYKSKLIEEKLPEQFGIWNFNGSHPSFNHIRKWYLVPEEFDFIRQTLMPWEKYMGPMIELTREEKVDKQIQLFLKLSNTDKNKSIIYLSFGTTILTFISEPDVILFYQKFIQIAQKNSHLLFIIKVPYKLLDKLKPLSLNVMLSPFVPQLKLLGVANLFITHGGGNSIYEALYFGVPMIIYPPVDKFDYNGNAARLIYHGIAEKMDIQDNESVILDKISKVLSEVSYKTKAMNFQRLLKDKYSGYYFEESLKEQLFK